MKAKRVMWVLFFLVFLALHGHSQEPRSVLRNVVSYDFGDIVAFFSVFFVDPYLTLDVVPFPSFGAVYERRINALIGFRGSIEIDVFDAIVFTGFGVSFYPRMRALHGWYAGAAGNICLYGLSADPVDIKFVGEIYSGYQWILPSEWVLRFGAGCRAIHFDWGWYYFPSFEAAFGLAF